MFAVYNTIRLILGDQDEEMTKVLFARERWCGRSNRNQSQNRIAGVPSQSCSYFLARTNTCPVIPASATVPPTISGPSAVNAIPRVSARASSSLSAIVSQ